MEEQEEGSCSGSYTCGCGVGLWGVLGTLEDGVLDSEQHANWQ